MQWRTILTWIVLPILVTIIGISIYQQRGLEGAVSRDDGIVLYGGYALTTGYPPYVSIFDNRGVIALLLSGLGYGLAQVTDLPPVVAVRWVFLVLSAATVALVYLLTHSLTRSTLTALVSAAVFLNFEAFAYAAAWGPSAKTPVVFFLALSLLLTVERRWFWAGVSAGLGALTWQPVAVIGIVTLVLAFLQQRPARWRAVTLTIVGGALPVVAVIAYYATIGHFNTFLDAMLIFSLEHRELGVPAAKFDRTVEQMARGYPRTLLLIVIGLWGMVYAYLTELLPTRTGYPPLRDRRWLVVLLSFPLPFILTALDFQSRFDFFLLLPFCALGLGHLVHLGIEGAQARHGLGRTAVLSAGSIALLLSMALLYAVEGRQSDEALGLHDQTAAVEAIIDEFGDQARVMTIGSPQSMALLERTNPHPFLFVTAGMDNYIDDRVAGGFAGWLDDMSAWQPDVIITGKMSGTRIDLLQAWLDESFRQETLGVLEVYVRNDIPAR